MLMRLAESVKFGWVDVSRSVVAGRFGEAAAVEARRRVSWEQSAGWTVSPTWLRPPRDHPIAPQVEAHRGRARAFLRVCTSGAGISRIRCSVTWVITLMLFQGDLVFIFLFISEE